MGNDNYHDPNYQLLGRVGGCLEIIQSELFSYFGQACRSDGAAWYRLRESLDHCLFGFVLDQYLAFRDRAFSAGESFQ